MSHTATYPIDLVLVRHGESEGNHAQDKSRAGDDSHWTPEFSKRHTSQYRLTSLGQRQAEVAGKWIKEHIHETFDSYYCSEFIRALETAALLDFPAAKWYPELYLREQDLGILAGHSTNQRSLKFAEEEARRSRDPFYYCPPGGESIAGCASRVEIWLSEIQKICSGFKVLAVCHGNILKAIRIRLERIPSNEWERLNTDPGYKSFNCQIIHYSRRNPRTGEIHGRLSWVRSVCPWDIARTDTTWKRIHRPQHTNSDLWAIVNSVPRLVDHVDHPITLPKPTPETTTGEPTTATEVTPITASSRTNNETETQDSMTEEDLPPEVVVGEDKEVITAV